jgi:hypothetical protein
MGIVCVFSLSAPTVCSLCLTTTLTPPPPAQLYDAYFAGVQRALVQADRRALDRGGQDVR